MWMVLALALLSAGGSAAMRSHLIDEGFGQQSLRYAKDNDTTPQSHESTPKGDEATSPTSKPVLELAAKASTQLFVVRAQDHSPKTPGFYCRWYDFRAAEYQLFFCLPQAKHASTPWDFPNCLYLGEDDKWHSKIDIDPLMLGNSQANEDTCKARARLAAQGHQQYTADTLKVTLNKDGHMVRIGATSPASQPVLEPTAKVSTQVLVVRAQGYSPKTPGFYCRWYDSSGEAAYQLFFCLPKVEHASRPWDFPNCLYLGEKDEWHSKGDIDPFVLGNSQANADTCKARARVAAQGHQQYTRGIPNIDWYMVSIGAA